MSGNRYSNPFSNDCKLSKFSLVGGGGLSGGGGLEGFCWASAGACVHTSRTSLVTFENAPRPSTYALPITRWE